MQLENKPENLKNEIESALNWLEILRIIHSLKISSFENLSECFTLTYLNQDKNSHNILPHLPRPRITQRRLKMIDGSNNELAILPSYEIHEVLRELSEDYLDRILSHIERNEAIEEKVFELKCSFKRIFRYGDNEEEISRTKEIFEYISQQVESLDPESKEKCRKLLLQLTYLVSIQKKYTPFVELKEPFPSKKHCIVNCTVETPKRIEKRRSLFYTKGEIRYSFSLLPAFVPSYHIEIMPPEGVDIHDFEFEDLERSKIIQNKREKRSYFDKGLLYIPFSPEETEEIHKRIDSGRTPSVTISMRINRLLHVLYLLVHTAILLPLFIEFLYSDIGASEFIACLALAATIFISASIYAIDKKIVQEFALVHLLIDCALLVVELGIFILL